MSILISTDEPPEISITVPPAPSARVTTAPPVTVNTTIGNEGPPGPEGP